MKKIIIAAIARNGVIGRADNQMPWHVADEFKHFKTTTYGFPIIMGRKTFESLGKPLKGRLNVVISKNKNWKSGFEEVLIFQNIDDAFNYCEEKSIEKIFITGGGEIYKQTVPLADEMILSFMNFKAEGEIFFPKIDELNWSIVSREQKEKFEIVRYIRN